MNEYIKLLEIVENKMEIRKDSFGSVIAAKIHNREEFDLMVSFWVAAHSSCCTREKIKINGAFAGEDWYFIESSTDDYGMDGKSTTYYTQTLTEKKQKFLDFCRKFDADEQPTVDAVPVVRCIECKYASFSFHQGELYISCENTEGLFRDVPEDGYCYCGEKVTE